MNKRINLVVATSNQHKLAELSQMLGSEYKLLSLKDVNFNDEIIENGTTFEQNAIIKAETVCKAVNIPTIADDSGLCVDALDGNPGIYSARYAGENCTSEQRNTLLLKNMLNIKNRSAHFSCAMALAIPKKNTEVVLGICRGSIMTEEHGSAGFGYDPLFKYKDGRNFAEMSPDEKNKVSHRGIAVKKLKELLLSKRNEL